MCDIIYIENPLKRDVENPVKRGDMVALRHVLKTHYLNPPRTEERITWRFARVHSATREGVVRTVTVNGNLAPVKADPRDVYTFPTFDRQAAAEEAWKRAPSVTYSTDSELAEACYQAGYKRPEQRERQPSWEPRPEIVNDLAQRFGVARETVADIVRGYLRARG